jgi:CRP/FNR family transcriptional regulator, cyclic AMP receptor protein
MSELSNFLKQSDIFFQFTAAQLKLVAGVCQPHMFDMGQVILEEGARSKDLYVIAQGEVEILVNPAIVGRPGTPIGLVTITVLRRGQSFGEIALVDEGVRSATVRAAQPDTRLLVLPRQALIRLCEAHPHLGYRLMYNLAADLATKMRNADLRLRENLLYGVKDQPAPPLDRLQN